MLPVATARAAVTNWFASPPATMRILPYGSTGFVRTATTGPVVPRSIPGGRLEKSSASTTTFPVGNVVPMLTGNVSGLDFARTPNHDARMLAARKASLLGWLLVKANGIDAEALLIAPS